MSAIGNWFKTFWNNLLSGNFKLLSDGAQYRDHKHAFTLNSALGSDGSYEPDNPSAMPTAAQSTMNYYTHGGLTGQQIAENEMSLDNQRRQYAFQVQGMQEAGLNPALMYGSGAQSAPSAPSASPANMSDLMSLVTIPAQLKLLRAQARETDTRADKNAADTENMKLINKYYPAVTESQIQKTLTAMGVDDALVQKYMSEVDLNDMEIALKQIQQVIEQAKADEAGAYYKAVREYEEANTEKVREEKAEIAIRAAMERIERDFMNNTNTKMGSSTMVALAAALGTLISNFHLDFDFDPVKRVLGDKWQAFKNWFKNNYQHGEPGENIFGINPE